MDTQKNPFLKHGVMMVIGILFIGNGTICNALLNGPLIQFFKTHVSEPIMRSK